MKLSLQLKIALLVVYVLMCTNVVIMSGVA